jgi:hypothetical protein
LAAAKAVEVTVAPFDIASVGLWPELLTHLAIGFSFGFVLERAGFGDSRKLAAQFYLHDMTVLKVMFSAIVTCMALVLWTVGLGWLDFDKLWVNPTYLWSGIVGGLIFGVGFVVGGYCPGTSLVAVATLKLDGLLFASGVVGGILLFGYTVPAVEQFWNLSGYVGRLTLDDWLGLPLPLVGLLVALMAVGMFAAGEAVERWRATKLPDSPEEGQ